MRIALLLLGMLLILGIAFALSSNRRAIRPRVVAAAFALHAGFLRWCCISRRATPLSIDRARLYSSRYAGRAPRSCSELALRSSGSERRDPGAAGDHLFAA